MSEPLVSVIIPAYNMSKLTVKTVESVLDQTYKNIEIIVVDDGSTDDTNERLSAFREKIKYIYKENGGACSARNLGITIAKGDYLAFLDCDDIYLPDKIKLSVEFLEKDPAFGMVYTNAYYIDGRDVIIGKASRLFKSRYSGSIRDKLIMKNFINNSTIVAKRECFEKTGLFDEELFFPADWEMWLRISEQYKIGYINKILTKYRLVSNACFQNLERTKKENETALSKFFSRNIDIGKRIKDAAYSNYHLSMAHCYLVKDNMIEFKKELSLALRRNIFNIKAIFTMLFHFLLGGIFRKFLAKRISGSEK